MIDDPAEQHGRIGRAVTSIVAEYAAGLDSRKVTSEATPEGLEKIFDEPFPEKGIGADEILAQYRQDVITMI